MVGVVVEQRVPEVEHLHDALVGDPVVDRAVLAPCRDEAAPAQPGEVVRDLRLRLAEPVNELADRQLALVAQQFEDANAGRVAQPAEVLRDQVAAGGRCGQTERGFQRGHGHLLLPIYGY